MGKKWNDVLTVSSVAEENDTVFNSMCSTFKCISMAFLQFTSATTESKAGGFHFLVLPHGLAAAGQSWHEEHAETEGCQAIQDRGTASMQRF